MQFGRDLRGYGVGTLMKLHQAGTLHATVQCKTRFAGAAGSAGVLDLA